MAEPYVDPKTFQLMWYQLTKQGWSFRKSVGLSNDQRYVPPDGNVKGTEGVDVFVGEKSLVKHYEAITEERQCVPESCEVPFPSEAVRVTDSGQFAVPDVMEDVVESAEDDIPEEFQREATRARDSRFVTLDDFDSEDFLTALRRDRLFEPLDSDDLNAEGDEDTILVDKDSSDSSDDELTASPLDDDDAEDPVEFALRKPELDRLQLEEWETYDEHHSSELQVDAAPLYDGPYGPTKAAFAFADSPLAMFYFFLPKELWRRIAEETNTYRIACIHDDAVTARARALKRRQTEPSTLMLTVEEYRAKLRRKHPVLPHQLVRYIGLLALQKTFFRGYRLGAKISFDEGMVPMRHRRNPMRQYMSAKPNKWGTKFYMTCCAETAYCSRLDIYCGKANKDEKDVAQRAVVKNLVKVLRDQPAQRVVCTDNYYTSIPLSDKLLSMGHYHVGTMRQDRLGWRKEIDFTQKSRPKRMPRGTFRIAQWRNRPEFVALAWMDSKPVRFLATGCSTQPAQVPRREPDGSITMTPCPRLAETTTKPWGVWTSTTSCACNVTPFNGLCG
ncbi:hypothetical protein F442_12553 [Phytophthora nicotianae P10297]|uniref:PiggyBac transposable element-derived protein domain-containing protein n=1 Tax=Phytophthora nicotianae P10297 TaxID=1317064 RepID=W2YY39_PHYNI|nr:hypothetical protein F442_12553 [Phytophthora nicotianae P10297]